MSKGDQLPSGSAAQIKDVGRARLLEGTIHDHIGAQVTRSTSQVITNAGSPAPVSFDTVKYDTGKFFDIASPTKLVCKEPGRYLLQASVRVDSTGAGQVSASIKLNGTTDLARDLFINYSSLPETVTPPAGTTDAQGLHNHSDPQGGFTGDSITHAHNVSFPDQVQPLLQFGPVYFNLSRIFNLATGDYIELVVGNDIFDSSDVTVVSNNYSPILSMSLIEGDGGTFNLTPPPAPAPPTLSPSDSVVSEVPFTQSPAAGSSLAYSRGDHTHGSEPHDAHASLTGLTTDNHHNKSHAHNGADGSGTVSHSATTGITATDHHAAAVAGPDADVTIDAAGAAGTASTFARSAHGHKISTSASTPAAVGTAAAGTSGHSPSRDDHVHATGAGTPTTQNFDDTAATGTGPAASMTDHKHGWPKASRVRVANSAVQSITSGSFQSLTFDTERWDTDTMHDTVTNTSRLTCKTAGLYIITAQVAFATGGAFLAARILLNGTTELARINRQAGGVTDDAMNLTTHWAMAVNDYVEVQMFQNSGGAINSQQSADLYPEFMASRAN